MRFHTGARALPALLLAAATPSAAAPRIQHQPPACFLAESYPRVTAVVEPGDPVARARVLFRPESGFSMPSAALGMGTARPASGDALADRDPLDGGGGHVPVPASSPWYAVAMMREGDRLSAVLPRPRMSVGKVRYVIEVTDAAAAVARDEEHVVEVVGAANACGAGDVAPRVETAQVVVEVPPGAPLVPPVPQGFSPVGASAVEGSLDLVRKSRHKGLLLALGGVALGGAAAASQLSAESPPQVESSGPPIPGFTLVNTFPSMGGIVSLGRPFVEVRLRVVPPEYLRSPTLRARLYSAAEPARTCGTMRAPIFELSPGFAQTVRLFILEEAAPCNPVDRVHLELQDAQGREVLSTGTSQPDLVINLVFTP
jgi:hypothetical protein